MSVTGSSDSGARRSGSSSGSTASRSARRELASVRRGAYVCPIATGELKRSLFGYRRSEVEQALAARDASLAEVEQALAARDASLDVCAAALAGLHARLDQRQSRVDQLEAVCDRLSRRVVAGEGELAASAAELERLRSEGNRATEALIGLAEELEDVRSQARGQATRIRLRALRDAAELTDRITECARRPSEARERMLGAIQEALTRIGVEEVETEPAGADNGFAVRPAAEMFDGRIEIEVGPLDDFSQLVGFEDAAGAITATSEISVKRFAQGRATLEMKLAEPVELLHELEQRAPFEFRVRDRRFDRLVLDVGAEAA